MADPAYTKQTVELWINEHGYPARSLPPNVQRWINRLVNEAYGRGVEEGKRQAAVIFGKPSGSTSVASASAPTSQEHRQPVS